jgi:peptidyl-prolyl cis-trans isomerase D
LPESVRLAYAELSLADVAATVQVSEEQLRERYEKNKATYLQPERRRGRHILITVDDTTSDAQASARAKELYERIKGGSDFAALAREFSKDSSSAPVGGDLNWSTREAMDKTLGERLFAAPGELSEPVKTQHGYHVLRLDDIQLRPGALRRHARGADASANELAATQFNSQQDQLQERLSAGSERTSW